jgi:hypothetical protein
VYLEPAHDAEAWSITKSNPTGAAVKRAASELKNSGQCLCSIFFFRARTHKSRLAQRLVHVRFGAHCGLNSDIAPSPRSANSRTSRDPMYKVITRGGSDRLSLAPSAQSVEA